MLLACLLLPAPVLSQPIGVPPIPPGRVETRPPLPQTERLVWQPGNWAWDAVAERYVWHSGRHVMRRPGTTRFVPGRWVRESGEWVWRKARWR
jgi:hypothetical protein